LYHPDTSKTEEHVDKFIEIQNAYDILSDPDKRKRYDENGADDFERFNNVDIKDYYKILNVSVFAYLENIKKAYKKIKKLYKRKLVSEYDWSEASEAFEILSNDYLRRIYDSVYYQVNNIKVKKYREPYYVYYRSGERFRYKRVLGLGKTASIILMCIPVTGIIISILYNVFRIKTSRGCLEELFTFLYLIPISPLFWIADLICFLTKGHMFL